MINNNEAVPLNPLLHETININKNDEIEVMEFFTESQKDETTDGIYRYVNNSTLSPQKWSRADEKVIQKYIFKALAYKTLYNESYFKYSLHYKLVAWPLIMLTCISLGLQMISATLITSGTIKIDTGILSIITTVVSVCVTILTYLHARTSFNNLARGCRKAGVAFSEFADQLNTILTINKIYRGNPLEVIKTTESDYKKLTKLYSEFEIPPNIYKSFINKHKNNSVIIDIATSSTDNFTIYDGTLEKNIIIDKFIDSINILRDKEKPNSSLSMNTHTEI